MKLYGVKNCHCCLLRADCKLKNSRVNLLDDPKLHPKTVMSRTGVRDITVSSSCSDFKLEETKQ